MAPSATVQAESSEKEVPQVKTLVAEQNKPEASETSDSQPQLLTGHREPLKLTGALDQYDSFEVTPIIGREYSKLQLSDLLQAPNSDELLRDLAITSKSINYAYGLD